ncbi:cysteine/serine-rich nuclear protein 3-like [Watersipora subatra]|uniref:cysteine/serine-rich nuclear protein 3-like n=1 Tax=Watersipora subatra TaxID=2589382 RepID=UPI00355C03D2
MPKRKFQEVDIENDECCVAQKHGNVSDGDSSNECSISNGAICDGVEGQPRKKRRKSVNFEQVEVFYFPRAQGFACVPSQGGTTLGMTKNHAHKEEYPLKHYRKLRKLVRRKKADVEESAENSFSIDAINDISQDEIVQTDSEEDDTETDGFFLQPVPIRLRRSLLKLSGVKKVDSAEREECKELRGSREECGCDCQTVCLPESCLCAINGIQCQVDRFSFPCGCTIKGCQNPSGRIEFNPNKVRKHYKHTMTRLNKETLEDTVEKIAETSCDFTALRHSKHIRFSDDGEAVEGEVAFNSTENGCCLDCSLTGTPGHSLEECNVASHSVADLCSAPSSACLNHLSCASDLACDLSDSTPHTLSHFSVSAQSSVAADNPLVSADNLSNCSSHRLTSLEPISGLLNPILNTVDSLDMYSLPHLHQQSAPMFDDLDATPKDDTEWQSLSHESLLTTNNLIPMKENNYSDSDSSVASSSHDSLEATDKNHTSFSLSTLKPAHLSFQLPSSHNVVHAMSSEFHDLDECKPSPTLPTISTEASA